MTRTAIASLGPRRGYYFSTEEDGEDMATYSQIRTLENLIFTHIDEEKQQCYLNQIREITKSEAADWIMEFEMGRWR